MAIYWVDPYVFSPNGGIHGTVSVGTGTYTNPWSLANIVSSTDMAVLQTGDEIRIKGLAESTFFQPTANTLTPSNTTISGQTYTTSYNTISFTNPILGKVQSSQGDIIYITFNSGTNTLYTTYSSSTWYPGHPHLNVAYGTSILDSKYVLSNTSLGSTNRTLFNNTTANITVTAGWTSETLQQGVTIFYANSSSVLGSTVSLGPGQQRINFDCANLVIGFPYSPTVNWQFYADTLKLKAIAGPTYSPGGSRISDFSVGQSGGSHTSVCGNVSIECLYVGGYGGIGLSSRASASNLGHTINLPLVINGYSTSYIYPTQPSVSNNVISNVVLQKMYGDYPFMIQNSPNTPGQGNVNIHFLDNWEFICRTGNGVSLNISAAPSNFSERINPTSRTAPFPTGIVYNLFSATGLIPTPSVNQNYIGPQVGNVISDYRSFLKKGVISSVAYKTAYRGFRIESPGENSLETVTESPLVFTFASVYGSPSKLNVYSEFNTYKPCQIMSPTTAGIGAIVYNSSNFGNKLTWKIPGKANGLVYADTYALPLPSYTSNNISFSTTFNTSTSPGATIVVRLYGYSQNTTNVVFLANIFGNAIGNVVFANTILSNVALSANAITSLYGLVDVTKTSTANAEIAFNTMTVSQV